MGSVTARTSGRREQPFLLAGEPAREAIVAAPAARLFPTSSERLRIAIYTFLFVADVTVIAIAFLGAGAIRLGSPFELQSLRTVAVVVPTFIAIAAHNGAYSIKALQRPEYGAAKALEALAYAVAVAIALLFYAKASVAFSRQIFAIGTILAASLAAAGRLAAVTHIRSRFGEAFFNRLIIVDGVPIDEARRHARGSGEILVSSADLGLAPDNDNPVMLDRIGYALDGCDSVVILCSVERRAKWSHALKSAAVDVEIVTPELDEFNAIGLGVFDGHRTLLVSARPLNARDRVLKRALDLAIAIPSLVLLAPLMLLIGLAILAESGGPVLFRQQRVGRNNRLFYLLKFRSFWQPCADPSGERSAGRGDERMTKVGKFIRHTSLDELPQLINVIAGDMSIVGPRPHALGSTAEDALFWKIDSRYFHRHAVKPGMTGLAQIRGYRGATARRHDLTNRLQADLEYFRDWTIWRDVKIILLTFGVIFHPNAF